MKKTNIQALAAFFILAIVIQDCSKSDLLNAKPQSALAVPSTLQDLQAMLEVPSKMNQTPAAGDASSDNYYMTDKFFPTQTIQSQNLYLWAPDIFDGMTAVNDWDYPYLQILYADVVLDALNKISVNTDNAQTWQNIKGEALFYRAYAFFNIAQLFAPVYDSATAAKDLGIPLRLSPDVNQVSIRSSVQQTYKQIISDLDAARGLLGTAIPFSNKNRPCVPAVLALKARIYLSIRNYQLAGIYSDSSLGMYGTLIDFNKVPISSYNYAPFTYTNNDEVIYNTNQLNNSGPASNILSWLGGFSNQISVDTTLYSSYTPNDLRKEIFFYKYSNGAVNLNGGYGGSYNAFSGLATNEMYLISAECAARTGNTATALNDLNTLLSYRWKTGTFVNYTATTAADALNQILIERRKELPFSAVRWTDLRRLNKDGFNISIKRIINGQTYLLPPNDPKYVLPIPPDVIQLSGIQQNQR